MADPTEAALVEAQLTVVMKQQELALLSELESGLSKLRDSLPATFRPGLLVAVEFCQKMRERQP